MYRIKIFNGNKLHEMENTANAFLAGIEDIEHTDISISYYPVKNEYVLILGIKTPDYVQFPRMFGFAE